ncbi:unnamed protein product [Trichogramma brassicae]|uniref:J domain-containing protein n=1 Tax=Trichogramma brassicae TaxID=86971 RepID=A0A6H5IHP6_9HYME|nr:unnamed protein product [Trichogramma brassicae]
MCKYRPAGWCAVRTAAAKCERASPLLAPETIDRIADTLSTNATDEEIKASHKKLALQVHPDKNNAPGAKDAFVGFGASHDAQSQASAHEFAEGVEANHAALDVHREERLWLLLEEVQKEIGVVFDDDKVVSTSEFVNFTLPFGRVDRTNWIGPGRIYVQFLEPDGSELSNPYNT